MTSEEEVVFLQEELETARKELSRCQAESSGTKKLLSRKVREVSSTLQLPEHEHPIETKLTDTHSMLLHNALIQIK